MLKLITLLTIFTATAFADLDAAAGCVAGRVVVQNRTTNLLWLDIKIEVNRDYVHVADAIAAGDTLRFIPGIFTKSDGTRLNLSNIACKTIDIHATVDGKRQHWNGVMK